MKYPIQIRELQGAKRLVLPVRSRLHRCFGNFEAIIDTGSPRNVISAGDAIRLRIPFNNLNSSSPLSGLGKGNISTVEIHKFPFAIMSHDDKIKEFVVSTVIPNVPEIRKGDENTFKHSLTLPSLIGIDFLEKNNLKLFVDIVGKQAYLEDIE